MILRFGATALSPEIETRNASLLRKKALLCMTTLYRTHPDSLDLDEWVNIMVPLSFINFLPFIAG